MTKQPSYRFAGYTEPWEEKKLGKIGETFAGLSGKTKEDFGHGDAKFITYVNVFNNPLATLEGVDKVEIDEKQSQVNFGDVLFTTSSETPEEVGMSSVWLWNEENVYLNSFCFGYRPEKGIFNPYYLAFMLRSFAIRREFMLLAQGISRYNISKKKVMEMPVFLPSLSEQTVIGSFFQDIDQLISLQQCKLEVLKEQKKTYLKLLFPAKGQTKPALRFTGFEDEWKEVKLGEVFEFYKGKGLQVDSFYEGEDNLAIAYGHLYTLYNEVITKVRKSSDNECSMYSNGNELLFPASSTVPFGTAKVVALLESGVKLGGDIIIASPDEKKVNNIFMSYNINSMKEKMYPITVGTTITHMYAKDLKELRYFLSSLPEQQAIGSFFQDLDKAITKQEEKVNQLKESKQTLLRKMFI